MKLKLALTILTLGLLIVVAPQVQAQHQSVKDFYNDYKKHNDVHRINLDGGIFKLITWIASWDQTDEEAEAISRITKNLKGINIIVVPKYLKPEKDLQLVRKGLKRDKFDELMSIREESSLLNFYAQGHENEVRDMVIFIDEEDEFVILSLKGALNLDDMKYLATHHNELKQ
ncbi:MAG: DUF4252 domain-containing protein [Candidatus Cyclobacteriaceae bacterium M2_1C_046]